MAAHRRHVLMRHPDCEESCDNDCDECPLPSVATIRRERMIRDDTTQPPACEAYEELFLYE